MKKNITKNNFLKSVDSSNPELENNSIIENVLQSTTESKETNNNDFEQFIITHYYLYGEPVDKKFEIGTNIRPGEKTEEELIKQIREAIATAWWQAEGHKLSQLVPNAEKRPELEQFIITHNYLYGKPVDKIFKIGTNIRPGEETEEDLIDQIRKTINTAWWQAEGHKLSQLVPNTEKSQQGRQR
ncbi:MAG: hypothetical protein IKG40_01140 [Bacilli bacterium]|nr:hypothetical protein [Bacilli bacterium]